MKNLSQMMKQAQEIQDRMADVQDRLEEAEIHGESGGGLIRVTLNGKGTLKAIRIDPSLVDPADTEVLEDLIVAAHADGNAKVARHAEEEMSKVTGGISLPPGFKLPF